MNKKELWDLFFIKNQNIDQDLFALFDAKYCRHNFR